MSTESIVNRVNQNFVQSELSKIDGPDVKLPEKVDGPLPDDGYRTPVNDPTVKLEESNKLLEQDPEVLKKAWGQLNGSVLTFEQQADNPEPVQVDSDKLSSQLRALVGGDDLKVFRQQVIRALKHLGVDTKKFFGE